MNHDCPTPDRLTALLAGALDAADQDAVERHIEQCPTCQQWLEAQIELPARTPGPDVEVPADVVARWVRREELPTGLRLGVCVVHEVIGRGGMGVVYRATDETLGRVVAVKVFSGRLDPDAKARFLREVQAMARVKHESIVQVYSAEDPPDGPTRLVMEFVDGPTLRARAGEARGLEPRQAAEVIAQVGDALEAAHAAGCVHRDVKPANVLLDAANGRAKLTDFGVARQTDTPHLTRSGMVVGTPAYMAPEQLRDPTAAGPRADVYGLGATFYEALTGIEPFRGSLELVIAQALNDEPLPPRRLNPAVPRDLNTVCLKAMAKDPAARYPTAAAMRDDLARWLRGEPVLARPVGWPGRVRRWARRQPVAAALTTALIVTTLAAFTAITVLWRESERRAEDAFASARAADEARDQADRDYRRAEEVVNHFYQRMYEGNTLAAPINLDTRLELIRDTIAFYEEAARRRPGEKSAAELGTAHARQGVLSKMLGSNTAARESYRTALALFERAEKAGPIDAKTQREIAECHFHLGALNARLGDAKNAVEQYRLAVERLKPLANEQDPQASYFLAGAYGNLAGLHEYRGERIQALAVLELAVPIQRRVRIADPKNGGAFQDLIWTTLAIAKLQPDASASVQAALAAAPLVEEYVKQYPTDYSRTQVLCAQYQTLAKAMLSAGRRTDAEKVANDAVFMAESLARYPAPFNRPETQAGAWAVEGDVQWAAGDSAKAEAAWRKAASLYEPLGWSSLMGASDKWKLANIYDHVAAVKRDDAVETETFRKQATETRERMKNNSRSSSHSRVVRLTTRTAATVKDFAAVTEPPDPARTRQRRSHPEQHWL